MWHKNLSLISFISDITCPTDKFRCKSNGRCIPFNWQCDQEKDCPDGSDEDPELCRKYFYFFFYYLNKLNTSTSQIFEIIKSKQVLNLKTTDKQYISVSLTTKLLSYLILFLDFI